MSYEYFYHALVFESSLIGSKILSFKLVSFNILKILFILLPLTFFSLQFHCWNICYKGHQWVWLCSITSLWAWFWSFKFIIMKQNLYTFFNVQFREAPWLHRSISWGVWASPAPPPWHPCSWWAPAPVAMCHQRQWSKMQQDSVECATQALEKYNIRKDIVAHIKREHYNPTWHWHCILGKNFGR